MAGPDGGVFISDSRLLAVVVKAAARSGAARRSNGGRLAMPDVSSAATSAMAAAHAAWFRSDAVANMGAVAEAGGVGDWAAGVGAGAGAAVGAVGVGVGPGSG